MHNNQTLKLEGTKIEILINISFWESFPIKKLTFIPHLKYIKQKMLQSITIIMGCGKHWLGSRLHNACFIYGLTRKFYVKILDHMHHAWLRLVQGTFKTSPIESLYGEAHEPPLKLRREKLALQYYLKLKSCPSNPAYHCTFNPNYNFLFDKKENAIKTFGLYMKNLVSKAQLYPTIILKFTNSTNPPWLMKYPMNLLNLTKYSEINSNLSDYMENIHSVLQAHPNHKHVYTVY